MAPPKKRHVHRVKLTDFKAKKADEGAVEIEADDGEIYRIDAPEVWSDEIAELAQSEDQVAVARALIGEDRYDAFVAAGGTAMLVMAIVSEAHGIQPGESSASSRS